MKVTVQYYALLREQKGCAEEVVETSHSTLKNLHEQLALSLAPQYLKVAINDEMAPWDTEIHDGDMVTFIPPVAGG